MWDKIKRRKKKIFENIYLSNGFEGRDSVSGPGSDLEQTRVIRDEIPKLMNQLNIQTILDIPCGDFYWMKMTDLKGIKYIGGDIVNELIRIDNNNFGNENIEFLVLDLLKDPLPDADLLLCRDCLVHLSYNDITRALKNISKSSVKYLLTTTFSQRKENSDIRTGQWRPLNLSIPPFNFPDPAVLINEECSENDSLYSDKSLGLWKISELPEY